MWRNRRLHGWSRGHGSVPRGPFFFGLELKNKKTTKNECPGKKKKERTADLAILVVYIGESVVCSCGGARPSDSFGLALEGERGEGGRGTGAGVLVFSTVTQ